MSIERVVVFGVGAAGSNLLLNLLASHPNLRYAVVDADRVAQRNIAAGTQPFSKADIGRHKTQAIQRIVQQQRGTSLEVHAHRIQSRLDIYEIGAEARTSLLIDCFDNAPSRNLFIGVDDCTRRAFNVLHVGFSGKLTGEACWNEMYTAMNESKADAAVDVCDIPLARPFIMGLSACAAIVAAEFIDTGKKRNVYFDRWLRLRTF